MRATEKYVKGRDLAEKKDFPIPYPQDNENLYAMLEKKGFWWNGKKKAWEKESTRPSTSIFADKKGKATGIMRLRLMCHPDEVEWLSDALHDNPHFTVIEESEKSYKNRKGAGYRKYLTIRRDK
jgi:hypothetical protein